MPPPIVASGRVGTQDEPVAAHERSRCFEMKTCKDRRAWLGLGRTGQHDAGQQLAGALMEPDPRAVTERLR